MGKLERVQGERQVIPEATSRGILSDGSLVADYYTAEPSPGKWIAVGTVMFWPLSNADGFPRWMLVGSGQSEQHAVNDLRDRMTAANPPRWKLRLGPNAAPAEHAQHAHTGETGPRYAVPWKLEADEVGVFESAPELESAFS